jgi:hypothetical protein
MLVEVTLRPVRRPADGEFLISVYAATRRPELSRLGWSPAQVDAFIRIQSDAQTRHYRTLNPRTGHSVIAVGGEPEPLLLRLVEVNQGLERPGHRRPFSLLFGGPGSPILEHRTHRILHSGMGEVELFLGPILSDSDGTTYEAVFA